MLGFVSTCICDKYTGYVALALALVYGVWRTYKAFKPK